MCNRFTQHYTSSELRAAMSLSGPPRNLQPRYNISPTDTVDVVRPSAEGREVVSMRWGLIPYWWKETAADVPLTVNARADTVDVKPMYRDAYKKRRCIIPASGLFEWTGPKGDKQGHLFTAADGSPVLGVAGLWDEWRDPEGERIASCTMIVTDATEWMQAFHDRLVVLLRPEEFEGWLDGSTGKDAIERPASVPLRQWCVTRRVNNGGRGKADDAGLIEPISCP